VSSCETNLDYNPYLDTNLNHQIIWGCDYADKVLWIYIFEMVKKCFKSCYLWVHCIYLSVLTAIFQVHLG